MAKESRRSYELLYIIPNKYTETDIPQIVSKIETMITEKHGGKLIKTTNFGKRRLAYPIKHNHYGTYILNAFEMDTKDSYEFDGKLRVEDEVLRHLITVALPEGSTPNQIDLTQKAPQPMKEEEAEKEAKKSAPKKEAKITDEKASAEEKSKMKKGTNFDIEAELGITADQAEKELAETKEKEKEEGEGKVDMKELDKKLDEIMEDLN